MLGAGDTAVSYVPRAPALPLSSNSCGGRQTASKANIGDSVLDDSKCQEEKWGLWVRVTDKAPDNT